MTSGRERLDVLIVTYQRVQKLERCLRSLSVAAARCPVLAVEFHVLVNGKDERAETYLKSSGCRSEFLSERLSPAAARNRLVVHASAPWIFFADDDVFVEPDFFETFLKTRNEFPDAAVIGGPNLTPKNSGSFEKASGLVLGSAFGAGMVARRYSGTMRESSLCGEEALILCNLFVRSDRVRSEPFPEGLVCAEENWVLQRLSDQGDRMVTSPRLYLWHERRSDLASFSRQIFKYGYGRGQLLRRRPRDTKFHHLLPSFCVGYALLLLLSGGFGFLTAGRLVPLFTLYGALCAIAGFMASRADSIDLAPRIMLLFPVVHLSYGLGVIAGFARTPRIQ